MKQMDEHFKELVYKYTNKLYATAYNLCNNPSDAEDIVQETFMKYLKKKPIFANEEHEKAWLIRTTLHRAADLRKAAARRNVPLEEALLASAPEPENQLLAAVRALPEKYGAVIHLHYYEGYSLKEIGKLLGLPAATVGTCLARGRERLRQSLKEEIE